MSSELRRDFHDRLAALRGQVLTMGEVVVSGVREATASLLSHDGTLAERVVARDAEIDACYPGVEAEVFDIVARQAPVARDLRLVIATFRIAANIERCGDLVASIARRAPRLQPSAMGPRTRELVQAMGDAAGATFARSMQSYAALDPSLAAGAIASDVEVDRLQRELLRELVVAPADVESSIDLALVARFYERVGDHGVVIAERVRFVALGAMDAGDRDLT